MEKILVFGHINPDTDSVASAIALSHLKNKLGFATEPRILGNINDETKFALNYFDVPIPKYLDDVKLQVKDINYCNNITIHKRTAIFDCLNYMHDSSINTLPVIDNNNLLVGVVSLIDIAKYLSHDNLNILFSSHKIITKSLKAETIIDFNYEYSGNIVIDSYFNKNTIIDKESILIINEEEIISDLIDLNPKLIILASNKKIDEKIIDKCRNNKISIIRTSFNRIKIVEKLKLCNYVSLLTNSKNVISIDENSYIEEFISIANKTKYSNYPVVSKDNKCLGVLRLADVADRSVKKVILVDHNEINQSVDNLEEAEIIEIVDHHKINTLSTTNPINFRNMIVGSTNTIIYLMYKEHKVNIPKDIAGVMMAGIISDTLLFQSTTTTKNDRKAVEELSKISGINYIDFAQRMFNEGFSLKNKNIKEIVGTDFKEFIIDYKKIGISQISLINTEEFDFIKEEIVPELNELADKQNYYIYLFIVSNIDKNSSQLFYNDDSQDILSLIFDDDITQGYSFPIILSRKRHIIPKIVNMLEKK